MINSIDQTIDKKSKRFEKNILSIIHLLHPYVKQRLKVGESFGIFPKNMFQSNGIIDEVVLYVYENKIEYDIDLNELRLYMFEKANKKLNSLFENEKWHKKSISTKIILEEELKLMEENFTIDDGFDLIMNDDLDDISYHQHDHELFFLSYEETQGNILALLGVNNTKVSSHHKISLQRMYRKLPMQTSNVVDLYVLGKLNLQEIANILKTNIVEVKRIILFVKENFKKQLF